MNLLDCQSDRWPPVARARCGRALIASLCLAAGCSAGPAAVSAAPGAPGSTWTFDRSTFDPSVAPCDDFYQYVCGGWERAPLPAGRTEAQWSYDAVNTRVQHTLAQLLAGGDPASDPELQRLRTFYASCTAADEARDRADEPTLQRWLRRIDAAATPAQLQVVLRELQAAGFNAWLGYTGGRDRADPAHHRAELRPGDLTLRRDSYADPSPRATARRDAYRQLIARAFALTGEDAAQASRDAEAVVGIEATLAAASPSRKESFDPALTEHPMTPAAVRALAPHLDWTEYLALVGHPADRALNVTWPRYLPALDQLLATRPLPELRAALRWRLLEELGDALPAPLADAMFQFRAVPGQHRPTRSEDCQIATLKALGVELSRQFAHAIGPDSRTRATRVAAGLRGSIAEHVAAAGWLSPQARTATVERVRRLGLKIGYPDAWPATGEFALRADAYLDNVLAARTFEQTRSWRRARAPWDRAAWEATVYPNAAPGIVGARLTIPNGFPDPFSNSIIVTAAGLAPPHFDAAAPLEVQYGSFGFLVGHELTHLLELHQFDAGGELHDAWTSQDVEAYTRRRACVIDQANRFIAFGSSHADGAATVDENVPDLSGLGFAYAALAHDLGDRLHEAGSDGTTPAQRFFLAYAQHWCTAQTPEAAENNLHSDPHGPPRFRVDGPLANLPAFATAFGCRAGSKMVRPEAERCQLW
ncbi:MAG TPA: M13 family metallopeptidase [Kofleriaceae bacterium]